MVQSSKKIVMEPIGFVQTDAQNIPRHWTLSEVQGRLVIDAKYGQGLKDIKIGQDLVVLFHFHKSPEFSDQFLIQTPRHRKKNIGVFSICSPIRPNPIGLSVLNVLDVQDNVILVQGLDIFDGTPILDIKPHIVDAHNCPSYKEWEGGP